MEGNDTWSIMEFVGHHEAPITEELVRDLLRRFRPGRVEDLTNLPVTDEREARDVALAQHGRGNFTHLAFHYPAPRAPDPPLAGVNADVFIELQASRRWYVGSEVFHFPLFEREPDHWFCVNATGGGRRLDHEDEYQVAWFLEKVRLALPVFRPDFGLFDLKRNVALRLGDDPRRRVWPILLYGPTLVERMGGRKKLLEAPAWRVEELDDGSIWLQAGPNPATATETELAALADHLGLEH